jgi:hypothetical protein
VAKEREAPEPREFLDAADRVVRRHRVAEAFDLGARDGLVEAKRGSECDCVQRPMGKAVAAAEPLRHRVRKAEPRPGERGPCVHGAFEQPSAALDVVAVGEDERERRGDEFRSFERVLVRLVVPSLDVERLGGVRESVEGGAACLPGRKPKRQLRLVDDPREPGAAAAGLDAARLVANPEAGSPLGSRVRGGDGDDGELGSRGDGLGRVDRAAAPDGKNPVDPLGGPGDLLDDLERRVGLDAVEGLRGGQLELAPALARDEERPLDAQFLEERPELGETPANDYESLSLAKERKASAARVAERPRARTM